MTRTQGNPNPCDLHTQGPSSALLIVCKAAPSWVVWGRGSLLPQEEEELEVGLEEDELHDSDSAQQSPQRRSKSSASGKSSPNTS